LPEPPNNPQVGMMNMRSIMPAIQQARAAQIGTGTVDYAEIRLPDQRRQTKIVKDVTDDEMARDIVDWLRED
jgi:electron transfer flavoprotein beta subunit